MKKKGLIIGLVLTTIAITAIAETNNSEASSKEEESVGWYLANIKEARVKNKECFDRM